MNLSSISLLFSHWNPGQLVSLNPQPLPPGPPDPDRISVTRPGDTVSLNPQPLPPKELFTPFSVLNGKTGLSLGLSSLHLTNYVQLASRAVR